MVRTFQHPSLKVGLFLDVLHGVEFDVCPELKVAVGLFLFILPGAQFDELPFGF